MHFFLFLISAYFMGVLAAVPTGPVQIEVVRRSVNSHLKPSLMVVLGAFFADVCYGLIAFLGIAPFLEDKKVMSLFWLAGGLILTVLGVITIWHSRKGESVSYSPDHLKRKRWAFLGGLSLSLTNPMMILWWLSGAKIFKDVGLISALNTDTALWFLAAGSLGMASYLSGLSLFIFWVKKFISFRTLQRINCLFGALLLLIAVYFLYSSFRALMQLN